MNSGVRIALPAMTNGTTNPLLTNTQSTIAAGFLSVLSTVGFPGSVAPAKDAGSGKQGGSDAERSQQDQNTATPQASAGAQNTNVCLTPPLPNPAVTELTVLPLANFHAIRSTASEGTPPATQQRRNDDTKPVSEKSTASIDAGVSVPVQPLATDVAAMATPRGEKPLVSSVPSQGSVGAIVVPEATASAIAAQATVPAKVTTSGAGPEQGQFAGKSEIAVASQRSFTAHSTAELTSGSALQMGRSAEPTLRNSTIEVPLHPAAVPETSAAAKTEAPPLVVPWISQTNASSAAPTTAVQRDTTPQTTPSQPNADSSDAAANNNAPATSALPASTLRSIEQHDLPFFFAQGGIQVLKVAGPVSESSSNAPQESSTQTPANDTAVTNRPNGPNSAQNVTAVSVQLLPELSFGSATSLATGTIGKPASKIDSAGSEKDSATSSDNKANSARNATGTADPAIPNAHGSNTVQHGQPDASQVNAVAMKTADPSAAQNATVHPASQQQAMTGAMNTPARSHSSEIATSNLPAATDATQESGATSGINTAKLIQTLSETQMHVGMRSAEFGDISIRTTISQQQMVAQITVDHGDLGKALTLHAPAAQTKLGDDLGVRAAIQVTQSGMSFSHDHGSAAQQEQRSFVGQVESAGAVPLTEAESLIPRIAIAAEESDRLDIRA